MILGTRLFQEIESEMVFCIEGAVSLGKTRLAFDIAHYYWRTRGWPVYSNIPHNFQVDTEQYLLYNSFVIFDEGGEFVRDQKTSSALTRSAGKANYISAWVGRRLPHRSMQKLVITSAFNFYGVYGLPFQLWKLNVDAEKKYSVKFLQLFPSLLHGTYSTLTSAGSIERLYDYAQKTVVDLARREGQEAGVQAEAGLRGLSDDLASLRSGIS